MTERLTRFYPIRLFALGFPNVACALDHLIDRLGRDENATVFIGENDVVASDFELAKFRDRQGVLGARVESLWTRWACAVRENGQSDLF